MEKRSDKLKKLCNDILSMNKKEDELINSINKSLVKIADHKNIIQKQIIPLSGDLRAKNDLDTSLRINDVIVAIKSLVESNSSKIINWKNEFIEINKKNTASHEELIKFLEDEYNALGILNLKNALDKTKAKEKIEKNLYRIINAITNANSLKELEIYLNNAVCARIDRIADSNRTSIEMENLYLQTYINFKVNPGTRIDFYKLESDLLALSQQVSEQIELERSIYISSFGTHTKNKEKILKTIKGFLTTNFIDRFNSRYIITKRDIRKDIKGMDSNSIKDYKDAIARISQLGFCVEASCENGEREELPKEEEIVIDADSENKFGNSEEEIDEFARKIASA